jgi:Uma2 family endonuclease
MSAKLIRIPDVCLFKDTPPTESVPTSPPYIAIEILSPDDKMSEVIEKFDEYAAWNVSHIWFVDPIHRKLFTYDNRQLHEVPEFKLADPAFTVTPEDIFTE